MKYAILFLIFTQFTWQIADAQISKLKYRFENSVYEDVFSKYVGTIDNNLNITMFLNQSDSSISGEYYYNKLGEPLGISGVIHEDNSFELIEEYADTPLGKSKYFNCKFDEANSKITGEWYDVKRNKKLPVVLRKENSHNIYTNAIGIEKTICFDENDTTHYSPIGGCNRVSIFYDEIRCENKKIQDKINDAIFQQIKQAVIGYLNLNNDDTIQIFKQIAAIKEKTDLINVADSLLYMGIIDISLSTFSIENNMISFVVNTFDFGGGAHGNSGIFFSSYDLKNGEEIELSSIVHLKNQSKLFHIADSIYNSKTSRVNYEHLDIFSSLTENSSRNSNNFLVAGGGLYFIFSQGEIASHAAGPIEIFIPFKEMHELIKQNSLLQDVIKK